MVLPLAFSLISTELPQWSISASLAPEKAAAGPDGRLVG